MKMFFWANTPLLLRQNGSLVIRNNTRGSAYRLNDRLRHSDTEVSRTVHSEGTHSFAIMAAGRVQDCSAAQVSQCRLHSDRCEHVQTVVLARNSAPLLVSTQMK